MEDPNYSYSPFSSDPSAAGHLLCDACGGNDFDGGDDGFFYCRQCGSQSQDVFLTAAAAEDVGAAADGALYSLQRHHSRSTVDAPATTLLSHDDVLRALSQSQQPIPDPAAADAKAPPLPPSAFKMEEPSEPRDFGSDSPGRCKDPVMVGSSLRLRYVQGLQVMLQRQCEALIERFAVSPMICGIAGTVWLRHLAASRFLDADWIRDVLASKGVTLEERRILKNVKGKLRLKVLKPRGQRASSIWFYSLRKAMPIYTTLAVAFLACHLAREAVLPTDIVQWALEGKLPFLAAFVDIDKYIGSPPIGCVLSSRSLFRPVRVIGAWQLEATAGSIAQGVGLRLPSVNFFGIARRYLKKLSLPVDKILPYACKLYEWSMPAELWLSSNINGLPTRVCVMAMLIVTIRMLYNIQGRGAWERSLAKLCRCLSDKQSTKSNSENLISEMEPQRNLDDSEQDGISRDSIPQKNLLGTQTSDFSAEELLGILEAGYAKLSPTHDYSKDLQSYLRYCKDIVFAGMTPSNSEQHLIDRLWDIYDKEEENDISKEVNDKVTKTGKRPSGLSSLPPFNLKKPKIQVDEVGTTNTGKQMQANDGLGDDNEKRSSIPGVCNSSGFTVEGEYSVPTDAQKRMNNNTGLDTDNWKRIHENNCLVGHCVLPGSSSSDSRVQQMKSDMEENCFQYLPPRVQLRADGYLHYRRQRIDGQLVYVAHADYYILLRSCAKLAQVDIRIMHLGVLNFERRLDWLEERIDRSLGKLQEFRRKVNDNDNATAN